MGGEAVLRSGSVSRRGGAGGSARGRDDAGGRLAHDALARPAGDRGGGGDRSDRRRARAAELLDRMGSLASDTRMDPEIARFAVLCRAGRFRLRGDRLARLRAKCGAEVGTGPERGRAERQGRDLPAAAWDGTGMEGGFAAKNDPVARAVAVRARFRSSSSGAGPGGVRPNANAGADTAVLLANAALATTLG